MATKLKIRMGHIEFEYEGDTAFDTGEIKDLFSHLEGLVAVAPAGVFEVAEPAVGGIENGASAVGGVAKLATNSVAARLTVKTGSDLAVAAAAHLQLVLGRESSTRKELLDDMKTATGHYKQNMSSNLTKMLDALISSSRFNEIGAGKYSLSAAEQASLSQKLAG